MKLKIGDLLRSAWAPNRKVLLLINNITLDKTTQLEVVAMINVITNEYKLYWMNNIIDNIERKKLWKIQKAKV